MLTEDLSAPHYKSQKIRNYFEEHREQLIPVWLPTASPEFMVLEECWNISKNNLLVLSYYPSFPDFKENLCIF
jgi:transposase